MSGQPLDVSDSKDVENTESLTLAKAVVNGDLVGAAVFLEELNDSGELNNSVDDVYSYSSNSDDPVGFGATLLMIAAMHGDQEMLLLLLRFGANPNECNETGMTPLMCAAEKGDPSIIESLVEAKALVDQVELRKCTALMLAAGENQPLAVRALLRAGADPEKRNESDCTALDIARNSGHTAIVSIFSECKPGVAPVPAPVPDKKGPTTLRKMR